MCMYVYVLMCLCIMDVYVCMCMCMSVRICKAFIQLFFDLIDSKYIILFDQLDISVI